PNPPLVRWTPWIKFPTSRKLLGEADPRQLSKLSCPPIMAILRGMKTLKQPSSSSPQVCTLEMKPPDNIVNFFSQMTPLCSQMIARSSSMQPCIWAFELNSLSMKDNGKELTYIAQFQTLQSRINWKNATFAFHLQKGLLGGITHQLALTGQQLKTLQQLINQTIEINNCYHEKIRSNKKTDSTPSTSKNKDASKYKKKFPAKPFTPSALTSAPRSRKPTKIALVLNKEGQLNSEEQARREREGLCFYCGGKHELESCVKRCGKKNCLNW
ncbi:uncharacterized protein VP01_6204g1, partial [Puccinia sorghi]